MKLLLEGIRVLDLSRLFPGPFCSMFLADMGAEVLRIEAPRFKEEGTGMDTVMRNKRHMTLNLQTERGKEIFFRLLEGTDVLMEGFRPGVTERLGIDYKSVSKRFPRIIYCSVTGYGQDGPYTDLVGHDINYLGFSGILGLNTRDDEPPVIPPIQIADAAAGGMCAAIGILAALYARERTGRGRYIDISMTDGLLAMLPVLATALFREGKPPRSADHYLTGKYPWYQVYRTKEGGYITLGALEHRFWRNLCNALGCPQYIPHQFAEGEKRDEIFRFFRNTFLRKTRDEWFEELKDKDVCIGKVLGLDEALYSPYAVQRKMVLEMEHPEKGKVKVLGNPIKFSECKLGVRSPSARWGEHTEEILRELGYSEEEIEAFRKEGVI